MRILRYGLLVFSFLALTLATVACGRSESPSDASEDPPTSTPEPTATPTPASSVAAFLPQIPGYDMIQDERITEVLINAADRAGLDFDPEAPLGKAAEWADDATDCLRDAGVADTMIYRSRSADLDIGMIAAVNRSKITNPIQLAGCLRGAPSGALGAIGEEGVDGIDGIGDDWLAQYTPCVHFFEAEYDEDRINIAYFGAQQRVCRDFCANLPDCEDPLMDATDSEE